MSDLEKQSREKMVVEQVLSRGVRDKLVLDAMSKVRREAFVSEDLHNLAYEDRPLPIAAGQTISQPYIVARMTEVLLEDGIPDKVLEIGTGSGYQAAVLSAIVLA